MLLGRLFAVFLVACIVQAAPREESTEPMGSVPLAAKVSTHSPQKLESIEAVQKSTDDDESEADPGIDGNDPVIDSYLRRTLNVASPVPDHLNKEAVMQKREAVSDDGREDMKAKLTDPLDEDCDSPQLGESEPWPIKGVDVDMDGNVNSNSDSLPGGKMVEQPIKDRQVLVDNDAYVRPEIDHIAAHKGPSSILPKDLTEPLEHREDYRTLSLPLPNPEQVKKSKCSRFLNGHDTPDPLQMLDDDCGMPEPSIPCETPGNSTLCVQRIQIKAPQVPKAELMPPVPPVDAAHIANRPIKTSVEFVDFGVTKEVHTHTGNTVGRVIEKAGEEFAVDAWACQLIRSLGVDINAQILMHDLEDSKQLVVYLTCTYRRFQDKLIVPIPACEDLIVHNFTAHVEVPAYNVVHDVTVLSTERVGAVLSRTPLDPEAIDKITYDGKKVNLTTPLEDIYFRNDSAFIVYPTEPCPSHTPSPTATPSPPPSFSPTNSLSLTPSPSPSPLPGKNKNRKYGAYDGYRHCRNSAGQRIKPPDPDAIGLDGSAVDPHNKANDEDFECDETEMTDVESPDYSGIGGENNNFASGNTTGTSQTSPNIQIIAEYQGREIPVLVKPAAKGIDIFDAVRLASGKPHTFLVGRFKGQFINHYTPLKPLGLIDGDRVVVRSPVRPTEQDDHYIGANSA